jgi:hypothetical protein
MMLSFPEMVASYRKRSLSRRSATAYQPKKMNLKYFFALAISLALGSSGRAQDATWMNEHGQPLPETEARRSVNGLAGFLLITPDADWREKWATPANTVPHFNETKSVERGQQVFVLIFFSNPKIGADGRANLTCDLDVVRPDGSASMHQDNAVCSQGELNGPPYSTYLAAPVIGFTGDPDDAAGTWTVRVSLRDNLSNTVLPLKTSFTLKSMQ